jgi:hypothetical protein
VRRARPEKPANSMRCRPVPIGHAIESRRNALLHRTAKAARTLHRTFRRVQSIGET